MIYFWILLDVLISNYTKYTSYFFLIYLYDKEYKDYLLTGLILDLIVFNNMHFLNVFILSIIYVLNKLFKNLNKENIFSFIYYNLFNYIIYIILTNLISFNSFNTTLIMIGKYLFLNILFYLLVFPFIEKKNI